MNQIDWAAVQTVFNSKTFRQQTKISKAVYNWNPTMARLHKITLNDYPSPMFNICKTWEETQDHIFMYNHPASRTEQINALRSIEKETKETGIKKNHMDTHGRYSQMDTHHLPPPNISLKIHPVHKLVWEAYTDQTSIGWNHAMKSRVSAESGRRLRVCITRRANWRMELRDMWSYELFGRRWSVSGWQEIE